jgi:CheY-like chemotaxis protein
MDGEAIMMTRSERTQTSRARLLPTVAAVVSRSPDLQALRTVLGAVDQVVFLDSMENAYSEIKRVTPDLIVMCLTSDDPDGCRVLSMLALDGDTSRIPVLTCTMTPSEHRADDASDPVADFFSHLVPVSVN